MLRRLLAGSALQGLHTLIEGLVGLLMLPFLISELGDRGYGMWILVMSVVGYLGFLNFGLGSAVQRTLSQQFARKDEEGASATLSTALALFCAAALAGIVVTAVIAWAGRHFVDDPSEATTFSVVVLAMGLRVALGFPSLAFVGVIFARLRHDVRSLINIATVGTRTVLIFALVRGEGGIVPLALISAVVDLAGVAATIAYGRALAPNCVVDPRRFQRATAAELLSYGGFAFLNWIADRLRFSVDNFVISGFLGLAHVTAYNVPVRLVTEANNLMVTLLGNLTPVFAARQASADLGRLRDDFLLATELSTFLGLFMASGLAVFGGDFIRLWVGEARPGTDAVLWALSAMTALATTQTPSVGLLYAINRHRFFAMLTLAEGALNLVLSLALVRPFGIAGVALGTVLPMVATKLLFQPRYVCRQIEVRVSGYLRRMLRGALAAGAVVLAYEMGRSALGVQIRDWAGFAASVLVFSAVFVPFYLRTGLTRRGRDFVIRRLLRLPVARKH